MRASSPFVHFIFSGLVLAQSPFDSITCQNGYTPSLTCNEPVPVMCPCTCADGATFIQPRPSNLQPVAPAPDLGVPQKLVGEPCTAEVITPWTKIYLPHKAGTLEDSEMFSNIVNVPDNSIFAVADSDGRCQHFEVYIDGQAVGETTGTGPLDRTDCGGPDNCMKNFGGSHGYFSLPKGQHTIGLKWIKVTEACKDIVNGVGSYQIYKPC